ncbi:hypothetical protein SAMN06295973_2803 [Plantibacter cousiniae]|uniref:Aminoglycoside phosphotransferase domain-containing protein n=2 Tax=Plantibacter cousiniae (nom. nud.) TaxID=199709 RepID=A0ABY1LNS1_9MICO|nr:hypothetical protein SAMN06295973_2803 [Plantibacter cousiniae]
MPSNEEPGHSVESWFAADTARKIQDWAAQQGCVIECERLLTTGRSGAIVGRVILHDGRSGDRRAILKVDDYIDVLPTPGLTPCAPFSKHLVPEIWPRLDVDQTWTASMQALAGGDLEVWHPLSSLSGTADSLRAIEVTVRSMLAEWNEDSHTATSSIRSLTGERALKRVTEGGALTSWISSQFDDQVTIAPRLRFSHDGSETEYVSPLWLLDAAGADEANIRYLQGRSHGDLHSDNILLPISRVPDPAQFALIDLAGAGVRSISDDPVNLLLSELERILATREHLLAPLAQWIDTNDDGPAPLDLASIVDIWKSIERIGAEYASARGFGAEWRVQFWCSIMGSALVLASRDRLTERLRVWFLLLASIAATKISAKREPNVPDAPVAQVGPPSSDTDRFGKSIARTVHEHCSHFDGTVATVAIISPSTLDVWSTVDAASVPWSVLIDFDALTTEPNRPHTLARAVGQNSQLVQPGQQLVFNSTRSLWLAADGLAAPGSHEAPERPLREWRLRHLPSLRKSLEQFASSQSLPMKVVIFGNPDDRVRAIVEEILDCAGERASLIIVVANATDALGAYDPLRLQADPSATVRALPKRDIDVINSNASPTIPGGGGAATRVPIPESQRAWFDEQYELLHSLAGVTAESVHGVGEDFYRGRTISWYELSVDADLPRLGSRNALVNAVTAKLEKRSTARHTFRHYPGAGGSTLVRRVAWDLRDQYPTIVVNQVLDGAGLLSRVQELARLSGRPVLAVVENTSETVTDWIFEQLRASSVPSLLLLSNRSAGLGERQDLSRELSSMSDDEIADFRRLFSALRMTNAHQVAAVKGLSGSAVPFLFALAAFQEDFVGLEQYVENFLPFIDEEMVAPLSMIALVHRYAGVTIQASAFAKLLGFPLDEPLRLSRRFGTTIEGLLLEERPGYWRTVHSLVAQAILKSTLRPKVGAASTRVDAWKLGLVPTALALIDAIASTAAGSLTDDMRTVLESTFIRRENRDLTRARYAELVSELSSESRGQIFEKLTTEFADEPHFWAHWGRWLSFDARDHPRARECFDEAIRLQDRDPLLWHMRGTAKRRELFDLLEARRTKGAGGQSEGEVLSSVATLAEDALSDFDRSWVIDDTSDFPLSASADLCLRVIEWGKKRSGDDSYAIFFRRPSSNIFGDLLDRAELAMDRAEELRADDNVSDDFARLNARLHGIYDDFASMISSWRNLIASADPTQRLQLRTRVARLYGERNGGWHVASTKDISSAMDLLNANLRDDPTDPRTARIWLRASRHHRTSVERATEVISNWVEFDKSRDALYHDFVITALAALSGGLASLDEVAEKLARMQAKTQYFGARRSIVDWYGTGDGFQALVHRAQVATWERRADDPPAILARVTGRVLSIRSNTSGILELQSGLQAFFTPAAAGFKSDEINVPVTSVVGFSFDGLQAWSVKRRL